VVTAIGVPGRAGTVPETTATVTAAAEALASAGAAVEEARPPGDGHALTVEVWRSYGPGMGSQELYRLLRRWDSYRAELGAWMASWDAILTRRDDLALALAAHLETAIGGWRPSPL
jgi:Asp-tRNA(Asn)/Glu-tRNA(Gln) amidotransferase A subunit family amidase